MTKCITAHSFVLSKAATSPLLTLNEKGAHFFEHSKPQGAGTCHLLTGAPSVALAS